MPLRALSETTDIYAFEYDKKSWDKLKSEHKGHNLLMPCCNSRAIPKTSKLGNHYFSHSLKGNCILAAESQEHLYIKGLVAKTAKDSGWDVKTEWQGSSPSGELWIADVYCKKGKAKVVFEIQLSRQTKNETITRQNRYKDSGVRCAWLASSTVFDTDYIYSSKNIPFFLITKQIIGKIPIIEEFGISLLNFIKLILSGSISWIEEQWAYGIHYIEGQCWKCKEKNKQIFGYSIDVYYERAKTVPNASTILNKIAGIVNNEELQSLGLNTIGEFSELKGNAPGFPFCNACLYCGAPQNNYYLMKNLMSNVSEKTVEYVSKNNSTGQWILHEKP